MIYLLYKINCTLVVSIVRVVKVCSIIIPSLYRWSSLAAITLETQYQPGKVANPARGQLNRENEYFPVPVRA